MNNQDQINQLSAKLELLLKRQTTFSNDIQKLQEEINHLKFTENSTSSVKEETVFKPTPIQPSVTSKKLHRDVDHRILGGVCSGLARYFGIPKVLVRFIWILFSFFMGIGFFVYIILWIVIPKIKRTTSANKGITQTTKEPIVHDSPITSLSKKKTSNLEKFIGENLINKIGIIIIIIGVAIGAKYSIEHDLISPLTRVILGYLVGLGLLGFGINLKKKYENFSAVLVSGAITILYFMTFVAYSFYELLPQTITFVLMALLTVFTVIAALNYNKQVIAHIGLVGAYAVPFLLSDDSGNAAVLFSYMAIINSGILIISFKKYWKSLYFSSFALTWLIVATWYLSNYQMSEHFEIALIFSFIFFAIFYTTFLAFKLLQKEKFEITDILLLLANSFVFYGIGYSILDTHEIGTQLLGVFTLSNGVLHFLVSAIIYKQKLGDKNLFYLVSGLVLVFITIAIPVQLNGNWVTLLWVGEAALLFWIGRTKNISVYENISYALMLLAVFSLYQDWSQSYNLHYFDDSAATITPIFNIHFLSSVLFIVSFGFIYILNNNIKYASSLIHKKELLKLVSFLIPTILLSTLYFMFRLEIENYWSQLYKSSSLKGEQEYYKNFDTDLLKFKTIWILNYSMLFLAGLSFLTIKKLKNKQLGFINLGLNTIAIFVFLTQGLYELSELRESYLEYTSDAYFNVDAFNIGIRYISFAFVAMLLVVCYKYIRQEFMNINFNKHFDIILYSTVIWIASSELINWLDIAESAQSYKLGLSILWGICSLLLIALGIWKNKKHLRIGAIGLFSITLIKLFFYDISHLDTISKTIVFLSLGILLLIISFLYNKFKHKISDDFED